MSISPKHPKKIPDQEAYKEKASADKSTETSLAKAVAIIHLSNEIVPTNPSLNEPHAFSKDRSSPERVIGLSPHFEESSEDPSPYGVADRGSAKTETPQSLKIQVPANIRESPSLKGLDTSEPLAENDTAQYNPLELTEDEWREIGVVIGDFKKKAAREKAGGKHLSPTKIHGRKVNDIQLFFLLDCNPIVICRHNKWLSVYETPEENRELQICTINPDPEQISTKNMIHIHCYIRDHKLAHFAETQEKKEPLYLSTRQTGLARSLTFTQKGKIYIHLNKKTSNPLYHKKKEGDFSASGHSKMTTRAVDIQTGKIFACSSSTPAQAREEIEALEPLKGIEGILPIVDEQEYISSKRNHVKARLFIPWAERGELFNLVANDTLSYPEKISIAKQLTQTLAEVHSRGVIHKDFKLENVVISGEGESIKSFIIDFAGSISGRDSDDYSAQQSTLALYSPELAKALLQNPMRAHLPFSQKSDVWALGVCMACLFGLGEKYAPAVYEGGGSSRKTLTKIVALSESIESMSSPPENSIESVIKKALSPNLEARPTAEELAAEMAKVNWDLF